MIGLDGFSWDLLLAAAGIAVIHTLLGPDHYLPFLMLGRACRWSRSRTLVVTLVCGVGHVLSSILLGAIGLALGVAVLRIEGIEAGRGEWAAWGLVAVGAAYALWGARRALRWREGLAPHAHEGQVHLHRHGGFNHEHSVARTGPGPQADAGPLGSPDAPLKQDLRGSPRIPEEPGWIESRVAAAVAPVGSERRAVTFWALFAIFVLGPCEPLIPLFVLPASRGRWGLAAITAIVFGAVTLVTMLAVTLAGTAGLERISLGPLERWSHAMAGSVLALSGLMVLELHL